MHGRFGLNDADLELLRKSPVFSGLDKHTFEQISGKCSVVTYARGSQIFHAGDPADFFYLITEGTVQLYRAELDGGEKTVNIFRAPQSFGEAAMFLGRAYPVSAQCLAKTRLIRIDAAPLAAEIRANPELAFGMLAAMSSHLKMLVEEITLLRAPTARQRLAEFLLRHIPLGQSPLTLKLPYSKTVIARQLAITPEMLSRTFAQLREHGTTVERDIVTIEDVTKLLRLVGLDQD
jgi:CRP-like cAMP-binding protein